MRIAGFTLLGGGGLVFLFLIYELFVTDLINARSQDRAAVELQLALAERRLETTATTTSTVPSSTSTTTTEPAPTLYEEVPGVEGEPLGMITIDKIGLEAVVFEGVGRQTLKEGPGHMPWTPVPGQPGNAVISGHRTTYGRPFYDLDLLELGDLIEVETAVGVSVFEVRDISIVLPTDVYVTAPIPGAWLTLTTCNPRFSARERLIVQAEMVDGPNFAFVESITAQVAQEVG